jgi:hypothetical protein
MASPSDFAPAIIKFKKLDSLPRGTVHSSDDVMKAMVVLHRMIHAQAQAYGGKNSKLLPVGIAEHCSFKTFLTLCEESKLIDSEKEHQKDLYARWKKLINMSAESVQSFKDSQTEKGRKDPKKYPGLKPKAAASIGISSGVQSANWVIKMKNTPVKEWTPEMWRWAGKQVSFVSRMLGNSGPLTDEDGNPTRKKLSLMIWGHHPK